MLGTRQVDKIMLGTTEVWSAQCKILYYVDYDNKKLYAIDVFTGSALREINYTPGTSMEEEGTAVVGKKMMFRAAYNGFSKIDTDTGAVLGSGGTSWGSGTVLKGTISGLYSNHYASRGSGLYKLDQNTMAAIEAGESFGRYFSSGGGTKTYLIAWLLDTGDDPSLRKKYTLDPLVAVADIGIVAYFGITNYVVRISGQNLTIYDDAALTVAGTSSCSVAIGSNDYYKDGGK